MAQTDQRRRCASCGAWLARDHNETVCSPCQATTRPQVHQAPVVPAAFWQDGELRAALESRHMGEVIRAYRQHPHHGRRGLTQDEVAAWAGISQGQLSRTESSPPVDRLGRLTFWATLLCIPQEHLWFELPSAAQADGDGPAVGQRLPALVHADLLRQRINDTLGQGALADASLEDWEQTVWRYGQATRDRSAGVLLTDLLVDLAELHRTMERCRSASGLRRLTRVLAQMSGLVFLTLIKLDERSSFRQWARTARLAAIEVDDPLTFSWVLAQEAYGHYYAGDLAEAVEVAQQAQAVAGRQPGVGVPLAAALEARAHAAQGNAVATRAALAQADDGLGRLDSSSLTPSALGYTEAQLHFHAGNAYTHLHDTRSALAAQERALELCAPGDYTDWALTRLDRADCLAHDGDVSGAMAEAMTTFAALTDEQRQGIIAGRGREILRAVPSRQRAVAVVRDFRDVLGHHDHEDDT